MGMSMNFKELVSFYETKAFEIAGNEKKKAPSKEHVSQVRENFEAAGENERSISNVPEQKNYSFEVEEPSLQAVHPQNEEMRESNNLSIEIATKNELKKETQR